MKKINKLNVMYYDRKVGTLALSNSKKVVFEYDKEWLKDGFSISPFSLPLKDGIFVPAKDYFQGLFGIFSDSLPDAWGNILLNRLIRKYGYNPDEISILDKLAIIGNSGMGALTYEPEIQLYNEQIEIDLDKIAKECELVLTTEYSDNLDNLFKLGGSSGGARPKILTTINNEDWIIKFPAPSDDRNIGLMEYEYSLCAKECGIRMEETRLFESKVSNGYFGTKRFDRKNEKSDTKRIHMASAASLLEIDYRQPSIDYHTLMKLTKILTKNNEKEIEQLFKIACFNVFAHNRDDHTKNFTYLYDETNKKWHLSPAYDMTYSTTYYGEHTTSVDGNGINPGRKELLNVGLQAGMKKKNCEEIINDIENKVNKQLKKYLNKSV